MAAELSGWLKQPMDSDLGREVISTFLAGLVSEDLYSFGCSSRGAVQALFYNWRHLLVMRGLQAGRSITTITGKIGECQCALQQDVDFDSDSDTDNSFSSDESILPILKEFQRWARIDANRKPSCEHGVRSTWGMEIHRTSMSKTLRATEASNISLRELHAADVALSALPAGVSSSCDWDSMPILGCVVLVWHAAKQEARTEAFEQLRTFVEKRAMCGTAKLLDCRSPDACLKPTNFEICISVVSSCLLRAKSLRESRDYLSFLMDALKPGHHLFKKWSQRREEYFRREDRCFTVQRTLFAPEVRGRCECYAKYLPGKERRVTAFIIATLMLARQSLPEDTLDQEEIAQKQSSLLAWGSQLLADLLPDHWSRGTPRDEDCLLRSAAEQALNSAEVARGGWAGDGAVDVALRVSSRRLRAKLGLRMGG